jgi:hypothetical protein
MPDSTDAQVLDEWRIATLLARYYQAIDVADWDALDRDVLADDARWEVVQRSSGGTVTNGAAGRAEVVAWFRQMVSGEVSMSEGTVRHFLGTHVIEVDGDVATSRSHLQAQDLVGLGMLANGIVDAEHVRTERGWRVRRFRVEESITDADMEAFRATFGLEFD